MVQNLRVRHERLSQSFIAVVVSEGGQNRQRARDTRVATARGPTKGCSRDSEFDRGYGALYRPIRCLQPIISRGNDSRNFFGKAQFAGSLTEMQIASVILLVTFGKNGH